MTMLRSYQAKGPDGDVWRLVIGGVDGTKLFRGQSQDDLVPVTPFLAPPELSEDQIRSALSQVGMPATAAEVLASQAAAV
jgi:hypothetical protein